MLWLLWRVVAGVAVAVAIVVVVVVAVVVAAAAAAAAAVVVVVVALYFGCCSYCSCYVLQYVIFIVIRCVYLKTCVCNFVLSEKVMLFLSTDLPCLVVVDVVVLAVVVVHVSLCCRLSYCLWFRQNNQNMNNNNTKQWWAGGEQIPSKQKP